MRLGVEYPYAGIPCADRDAKLVGTTGLRSMTEHKM